MMCGIPGRNIIYKGFSLLCCRIFLMQISAPPCLVLHQAHKALALFRCCSHCLWKAEYSFPNRKTSPKALCFEQATRKKNLNKAIVNAIKGTARHFCPAQPRRGLLPGEGAKCITDSFKMTQSRSISAGHLYSLCQDPACWVSGTKGGEKEGLFSETWISTVSSRNAR